MAGALLAVLIGGLPGSAAQPPVPAPGYHHLGATTEGTWSGVLGRVSVRDPGVRAGTFDFVATRFMAKAYTAAGVKWLEAGWAETGWTGAGQQRIYTFDTNSGHWTFYDEYPIRPGDDIWLELVTTQAGESPVWSAWLWWGDGWHLLTAQPLPLTDHATIEEYVEVYVDPARGGTIAVPPVRVDNVQLKRDPGGGMAYWNQGVPTLSGVGADGYCLTFQLAYDTWAAGSCPAT
jgi:hypothetical protein